MSSKAPPPSTDNDYTFGAESPISSRAKKKKKSKSTTTIDTAHKDTAPSSVDLPLAHSEGPPIDAPVHEHVESKTDAPNDQEPPEENLKVGEDLHTKDNVNGKEPESVDLPSSHVDTTEVQEQFRSDGTAAMGANTETPVTSALATVADSHESTLHPASIHNKEFVRHETDRRPLDPAPDRRHPSLQVPSPKPSPHITPVKVQEAQNYHLPLLQPQHSHLPDPRYTLVHRPSTFVPAAQVDMCATPLNGRHIINNLLLLGNEGGLDVCRLNRQRDIVGRLEGLRGVVLEAKFLQAPLSRNDPLKHLRPLVACVVHGPVIDQHAPPSTASSISAYQTTVDIYSLKTSSHMQTLFSSPPITLEHGASLHAPPAPDFHIALAVSGRFVTIALGNSGEVLVFDLSLPSNKDTLLRCIAKFWTVCKPRSTPSRDDTQTPDQSAYHSLPDLPLFSLSGRWLVIVPPLLSSSQKSADGKLPSALPSDPSIATFVSPPPPHVDCEVDAPADGGMLNRVTKQATQEVVKGAQWVGEQGLGMLKSYWRRASQTSGEDPLKSAPIHQRNPSSPEDAFPPTHGHPPRKATAVEAALVSIIDLLQFVAPRHEITPEVRLATFSLSDGCSFLSLDPEGLSLLTTNQLGDTSSIWDMTRIMDDSHALKMVSRITQYPRLSPSSVVDVQWTAQGRRVGILTQKGTLHLHEVPRRDSDILRRRSSLLLETNLASSSTPTSPSFLPASGSWVSNVVTTLQTVQHRLHDPDADSLVDSTRKKLGEASLAARHAGGRAVRNGYTSALGGAQTLRHAQRNKIRLKSDMPRPGRFRWLAGKAEGVVALVDESTLSTFAVKTHFYNTGRRLAVSLDAGKKVLEQPLGISSGTALPPSLLGRLDPTGPFAPCAKAGVHGFWLLASDKGPATARRSSHKASGVLFDKETCPQYMPFHRHRQVDVGTFDGEDKAVQRDMGICSTSGKDISSVKTWVFGLPLPSTTRVNIIQSRSSPDTDVGGLDETGDVDDGFSLRDTGDNRRVKSGA